MPLFDKTYYDLVEVFAKCPSRGVLDIKVTKALSRFAEESAFCF